MTYIMKLMKKRIGNQRGVTLIELLAVIVILGVISAIAAPIVFNEIDDANVASGEATTEIVLEAAERYLIVTKPSLTWTSNKATIAISAISGAGFLKDSSVTVNGTVFTNVEVTRDGTSLRIISMVLIA